MLLGIFLWIVYSFFLLLFLLWKPFKPVSFDVLLHVISLYKPSRKNNIFSSEVFKNVTCMYHSSKNIILKKGQNLENKLDGLRLLFSRLIFNQFLQATLYCNCIDNVIVMIVTVMISIIEFLGQSVFISDQISP